MVYLIYYGKYVPDQHLSLVNYKVPLLSLSIPRTVSDVITCTYAHYDKLALQS